LFQIALLPDSITGTILTEPEREVLIAQLQLINQVFDEEIWPKVAFLFMVGDDEKRGIIFLSVVYSILNSLKYLVNKSIIS